MQNYKILVKRISIVIVILILSILTVTWVFPYASLSVAKAYTIKQDPIVVKQYVDTLQSYKKLINENKEQTNTYATAVAAFDFFEQVLMENEHEWRMTDDTLEELRFQVATYRDMLITLSFSETYSNEARMYLKTALNATIELEDSITFIQMSEGLTRKDLRILIGNLYGEMGRNLEQFITFYQQTTAENGS
ncbi:hypothetical protein BN988_03090 [Oceanobacillus picturae]|uniref:Uncharacterized protein n=1 Tax=Oceanobacillus picturae TaxID=171693 RepID=W9BE55_9BACI|nr:hypothetical protein [Oceanobacillus picturae]CDO04530.1 hypothetical protein BN988_03090 [Oceanobacillus picturae]